MQDMYDILGPDRYVVLAKEITKKWETIKGFTIKEMIKWLKQDITRVKGEIVLIIKGFKQNNKLTSNIKEIFFILIKYMKKKDAALIISKIYNLKKRLVYNIKLQN